jgi:hypothetical protein
VVKARDLLVLETVLLVERLLILKKTTTALMTKVKERAKEDAARPSQELNCRLQCP